MGSLVGLLLAAAVAAAVWFAVRRRSKKDEPAPAPVRAASPFGAVEISVRSGACKAARRLSRERFLSTEAPALPLAGCTAARCECKFVKLSDRRTDDRRLDYGHLHASAFIANERRSRGGRRSED